MLNSTVRNELVGATVAAWMRYCGTPIQRLKGVKWGFDAAECDRQAIAKYGEDGADWYEICENEVCANLGTEEARSMSAPRTLEAGFSTGIVQQSVEDSFNGRMLQSYAASPDTMSDLCRKNEVNNFLEQERSRVQMVTSMKRRSRGEAAQHADLSMTDPERFRLVEFAQQDRIDQMGMINSPMVMAEHASAGGESARNHEQDSIVAALMRNPVMGDGENLFSVAHANFNDSAALSYTTLDAERAKMRLIRENGNATGIEPEVLLVSAALEGPALRILRDMHVPGQKNIELRVESRIDTGLVDPLTGETISGDPTMWFLFSKNHPAIEISYREPQPEVRTWTKNEGGWVFGWSIRWALIATPVDFRSVRRHKAP